MLIAARYNGPPRSGNGGYSSGVFARALGPRVRTATVTLRRPPPLDVPLTVRRTRAGLFVYHSGRLIAEAVRAVPPAETVPPVSVAVARTASSKYPGLTEHPFPTCYVCGPLRPNGLRIFPGRLPDGRTAAVWTVPPDVRFETVWAALDCPGAWAIAAPGHSYGLRRMTCSVRSVPIPGSECVVVGGFAGSAGRKAYVRSTLYDPDATVLAVAAAIWLPT